MSHHAKKTDQVQCTCNAPTCKGEVSSRTRRRHILQANAKRARAQAAQNASNAIQEALSDDSSDMNGNGSRGDEDFASANLEPGDIDMEDAFQAPEIPFEDAFDDLEDVNEELAWDARYMYDGTSGAEEEKETEGAERLHPELEDFDVFDYYAPRMNVAPEDPNFAEDDETMDPVPEIRVASPEMRSPLPQAEVNHADLQPAITHLVDALESSYCHSVSEEAKEKMQQRQDYLDAVKDDLTEEEIDDILGFSLRTRPGMSSSLYEEFRAAFSHRISLSSSYKSNSIAEKLSGICTREVDCCANSCMAFTGNQAELEACVHCNEPRRDTSGRRRNTSYHYSLVDRLQGMFQDPKQSHSLNRDNVRRNANPDVLADKFDGDYFLQLCQRTVMVEGVDTGRLYFSDGRDISITISLDGFTFFETLGKHTTKTKYNTWLIIAIIDNLDPLVRTQRKNIMILGVIPGPGSPKDMNSFLYWLKRDLHILSLGVLSWDAAKREWFLLHAFLLWVIGDMPAIAHIMNMKGHNGICPCQACYIQGTRNITQKKTTYYPVLGHPDVTEISIPTLLEENGRTHEGFLLDVADIKAAKDRVAQRTGTLAAYKKLLQELGINGWSILYKIDSVSFPRSFVHDLMHLGGLNTIPNLKMIWTGEFNGLKDAQGNFDYIISPEGWEEVGRRTEEANAMIPYAFSRAIPNVARKQNLTAEAWFFWFLAIAPYALADILKEPYYSHAMDLTRIIRTCMKFEITRAEVSGQLTDSINEWVLGYERLYYQHREDRLGACPSTVHAWLHLPQDILNAGPLWQHWAFPMEREVQRAKAGVKDARSHPFVHMAARALKREQIKQLGHRLGLSKLLDVKQRIKDQKNSKLGPKHERQADAYKDFELCSPRKLSVSLEDSVRNILAAHLAAMHQPREQDESEADKHGVNFFKALIPRRVEKWGKVRICGGGDMALGSNAALPTAGRRDTSFIRYHMIIDDANQICYGQLHYIVKFALPEFADSAAKVYILALITPCITNGTNATTTRAYYKHFGSLGVADLTCFVSTVGRVPMGNGQYGIIDRSTEESWPTVYEDVVEGDAEGLEEN